MKSYIDKIHRYLYNTNTDKKNAACMVLSITIWCQSMNNAWDIMP